MVFVLNSQGLPEPKELVTGITDGSFTEVVSGDLKAGDPVITSDSSQAVKKIPDKDPAVLGRLDAFKSNE